MHIIRNTCMLFIILCAAVEVLRAQGEPFTMSVLNQKPVAVAQRYNLAHPFEIIYGPDNFLYVTEKIGRVLRVNTTSGQRQVILDHRASTHLTISRNGSGVPTSLGQDGMMGMALHPNFGMGTGQDYIYIAYTYASGRLRISRFTFSLLPMPQLNAEFILIEGIPASNDHSSGRLVFGADNLLYYACGDMGANQFGNRCQEVRSQKLPTAAQLAANDYSFYAGKILRIDPAGSVPASNPVLAGVRSHIFSLGHRNAQGLVAQKNPSNGLSYPVPATGGRMFSSEHGPRTDDEINVIENGGNYGWPYIAGYLDNLNYQYVNWSTSGSCATTPYSENAIPSGAMIRQESDSALANFHPPLSTLYTACSPLPLSVCDAGGTNWMRYPTIAPSSIDFYAVQGGTGIPGWYGSLLVPTLRRGVLFRYKLNTAMNGFDSDSIPYFRTSNRYRDLAISPDGRRIFIITDSTGTTSGPSGTGTNSLANPGAILEFTYAGPTLALGKQPENLPRARNQSIRVFPNPVAEWLQVEVGDAAFTRFTEYSLTDLSGRIVAHGKSTQKNFRIDLRVIPTGMYICKLRNGLGLETASEKIIIRR